MKQFTPIFQDGILIDVETNINDQTVRMLGKGGAAREEAILVPLKNHESPDNILPVLPILLGAGLGHALKTLLATTKGPIAVVDKESELFTLSKLREKYPDPRIFWLIVPEIAVPEAILRALTMWQVRNGDKPFLLLAHPFYQRIDPWYKEARHCLNIAPPQHSVWKNAQNPRFTSSKPRLLFLTSKTFFMCELINACDECGYDYEIMDMKSLMHNNENFMLTLLQKVTSYKPDYLFTINHYGIDTAGIITDLLERMQIPLASWFVDDPLLRLAGEYRGEKTAKCPWYTIFSWDADKVAPIKDIGYKNVFHLPLCTNPKRFFPRPRNERLYKAVSRDITFVGRSSVSDIDEYLTKTNFLPKALLLCYRDVAKAFAMSSEHSVDTFLHSYSQKLATIFDALSKLDRICYEILLIWVATEYYRTTCIRAILPFNPLIIGDKGWFLALMDAPKTWIHKPSVSYEKELPRIYPYSTINFNCTHKQMKGAVNQRIFDVPAAGSFVLTDWQEQMDALLERDKEIIAFHEIDEIPELVRFYLENDTARKAIITAGRKRVLAEHTWTHRLRTMTETMKEIYGA